MEPEEFLENHLPEVGTWTFFDTAHTMITHNEYDDEKGDLLVVKHAEDNLSNTGKKFFFANHNIKQFFKIIIMEDIASD